MVLRINPSKALLWRRTDEVQFGSAADAVKLANLTAAQERLLGLLSRAALWRTPLVLGALVWSCRASVVFLSEMVTQPRRLLAVYPVALFYAVVAWMIFIQQ